MLGREAKTGMGLAVCEARVDLVADDQEIVAFDYVGDRFEGGPAHRGAGWIAGVSDQERLCFRREMSLQDRRIEFEVLFNRRGNGVCVAAGQHDARQVGDVARVG